MLTTPDVFFPSRVNRDDLTFTYTTVTQLAEVGSITFDVAVAEQPLFLKGDAVIDSLTQLPLAASAVVMGYNLPELNATTDTLVFDVATLARIWRRDITVWNHSAIADLNPALAAKLPNQPIALVYKQTPDIIGADITGAFVQSMSHDADFKSALSASGGSLESLIGANGHPIVNQSQAIGYLTGTPYTMGYFALRDANTAKVKFSAMRDASGSIVQASTATVQAAMTYYRAQVIAQKFVADISNGGNGSWPMSYLTAVALVFTNSTNSNKCVTLKDTLDHLSWTQVRDSLLH
jgi:ABC-type phosphate transport system substrate-binding protein